MKASLTYQKAYEELTKIVAEIESEKIQLDQLAEKIRRAGELIEFCKVKLRSTEEEFAKIIGKQEE